MRTWTNQAIQKIEADFQRSADTHLIKVELPAIENIQLYLKDESTHPTGSLKHRLARSLFLYGLCNGWIQKGTTVVEASSGSTAVSEAYFAKLLDLPFIAVMPEGTSQQKIDQITFYGGKCHMVQNADIYGEATRLARELNGHYMDQFTYAAPVRDLLGIGELVHVVALELAGQAGGFAVDVRVGDHVAFAAVKGDLIDFLLGGALGHHGDEGQIQQLGEVGLGYGRAARRGLNHRCAFIDPAVAQTVQEQGAGQAVLEASCRVGGLVLEVELNIGDGRQFHLDQVGVGGALKVGFDFADGLIGPVAHAWKSPVEVNPPLEDSTSD